MFYRASGGNANPQMKKEVSAERPAPSGARREAPSSPADVQRKRQAMKKLIIEDQQKSG